MKKFFISKFATMIIVSLAMLSNSCNKENIESKEQTSKTKETISVADAEILKCLPEVKDGRVIFKDDEQFNQYVHWLYENQNNPNKILDINKQLNFTCMEEIYLQGIETLIKNESESSDFTDAYPNVFFPIEIDGSIIQDELTPSLFCYFLNKNGIYQIGNNIIRMDYNYTYRITDGDESKIPSLITAKNGIVNNADIEVSQDVPQTRSQYSYRTEYFDSKHRVVARLKHRKDVTNLNTGDYYEYYDAVTNAQKKAGAWLATSEFDYVSLKIHAGYYSYNNGTGPFNTIENTFTSTTHKVKKTYIATPKNISVDQIRSLIPITHSAKYNGSILSIYYSNAITAQF